jgi:hypothetical protein
MGSKSYSMLLTYWSTAIGVAIGTASVLLSRDALLRALEQGPIPAVTIIAVLAATLLVFVLYMEGTREELNFGEEYRILATVRRPQPEHVVLIIWLAICFGGLIAFATNLLVYCGILICLEAGDLFGTVTVRRRVRDALKKGVPHLTVSAKNAFDVYYNGKGHLWLRSFRLLGTGMALGLAIYLSAARRGGHLAQVGWAIVIVSMLSAEYVHHLWRTQLRRSLAGNTAPAGAGPHGEVS